MLVQYKVDVLKKINPKEETQCDSNEMTFEAIKDPAAHFLADNTHQR